VSSEFNKDYFNCNFKKSNLLGFFKGGGAEKQFQESTLSYYNMEFVKHMAHARIDRL